MKRISAVQRLKKGIADRLEKIAEIQDSCEHEKIKIIKQSPEFTEKLQLYEFLCECTDCSKPFKKLKTVTCMKCLTDTMECFDSGKEMPLVLSKFRCTTCKKTYDHLHLSSPGIVR